MRSYESHIRIVPGPHETRNETQRRGGIAEPAGYTETLASVYRNRVVGVTTT